MNKKLIFTAALVMTLGAVAFAQGYRHNGGGRNGHMNGGYGHMNGGYSRNDGYGRNGYGHMNSGYGHGGRGGCYGNGYDYGNGNGYTYTQEEQVKIDSIHQKYFNEFEKLRADMYAKNGEIRVEMNQKNPNQSKIDTLIDQQSKLRADLDKLSLKVDSEIRTALGK